jgi:Phage major capsid protein E
MDAQVLDIFGSDMFKMANLTMALNKRPTVPMAVGKMGLFTEQPLTTDNVVIEELNEKVGLLPYTHKNGPGTIITADKRTGRPFTVPTIEANAEVWASDVAAVRAFGMPDALQTVAGKVMEVTDRARTNRFEPTFEFLRVKSLAGYIGDPGTPATPILDLCAEMGVTRATALNMAAGAGSATVATQIGFADTIRERVVTGLGGIPFTGIVALCGRAFFRALKTNAVVRDDVKTVNFGLGMQAVLLQNLGPNNTQQMLDATPVLNWQGITWIEYSLSLGLGVGGAVEFIPSAEAIAFPTGVPGQFVQWNAPAAYIETINTPGLPLYAKSELKKFGKGVDIALTSRPFFMNSRPSASVRLY